MPSTNRTQYIALRIPLAAAIAPKRLVQRGQLFADRRDLRLGVGFLGALLVDHRRRRRLHETLVRELAVDTHEEAFIIVQLLAQFGDLGFTVDLVAQRHEILRSLDQKGRSCRILLRHRHDGRQIGHLHQHGCILGRIIRVGDHFERP